MDERTEPVNGQWAAEADPADQSTREPFSRRQVRDVATEDFPYRAPRPTAVCPTCRVPGEHCLCRAEPDRLRYALAQISLIHQVRPDGTCSGCGTSTALCGYITLLDRARGTT